MAPSNGSPNTATPNASIPFSYAQAAKGRVTAPVPQPTVKTPAKPPVPAEEPSKNPSPSSTKVGVDAKFNWAEDANANAEDANKSASDVVDTPHADQKPPQNDPPKSDKDSTTEEWTMVNSENSPTEPSTPSGKTAVEKNSEQPRLPRSVLDPNWRDRPQEQEPQNDSPARSDEVSPWNEDARSETGPKPLTEAPPPTVNPWIQRAQMFKSKPSPVSTETRTASTNGSGQDLGGQSRQKETGSLKQNPSVRNDKPAPRGRARNADFQKSGQGPRARSLDAGRSIPAIGDQTLWPTPDTAQLEDRHRTASKGDKSTDKVAEEDSKTTASKPHGKQGWVQMDITPTVKFETEFPTGGRRGGRGGTRGGTGRGGRDGSIRGGLVNNPAGSKSPVENNKESPSRAFGDNDNGKARAPSTTTTSPAAGRSSRRATESKRAVTANNSPTSHPGPFNPSGSLFTSQPDGHPENPKFTANADIAPNVNQRAGTGQAPTEFTTPRHNNHGRRRSMATMNESNQNLQSGQYPRRKSLNHAESADINNSTGNSGGKKNSSGGTKAGWNDQKQDGQGRAQNRGKDSTNSLPFRDRGDQRPERGRGGKRGRGNGHANTGVPQVQIPYQFPPPPFQPHASPYGPRSASFNQTPNGHSGRGGQRSVSIPSDNSFAPHPYSYPNSAPMPYQPQSMAPLYPPYVGPEELHQGSEPFKAYMQLMNGIANQLNFWFSFDNLIRDEHLQSLMDSEGFVSIRDLMKFPRLKLLTSDEELVKIFVNDSPHFILGMGPSGEYRIRNTSDECKKFVRPMEAREPSAQHDRPSFPHSLTNHSLSPFAHPGFFSPQMPRQGPMPFQDGYPRPPSNSMTPMSRTSPRQNDEATNGYPLPAATAQVPPADNAGNPPQISQSGEHEAPKNIGDSDDFPNNQIQRLSVLSTNNQPGQQKPGSGGDEVQNGVLHGKSMTSDSSREEERQPRSLARSNEPNDRPPNFDIEELRRSLASPTTHPFHPTPKIPKLWSLEGIASLQPLPAGARYEPYENVRAEAFFHRNVAKDHDAPYAIDFLYSFWTHFLVSHFNNQMYDEFVQTVQEDVAKNAPTNGLSQLLKFYSNSLSNSKPMKNKVARDYVDLVEKEDPSGDRPAFRKLRNDWRNGAIDMRNRKKINDIISSELRQDLEQ